MATAGEGATSYEGGGGKFRKKPLRRSQKTPYDRPPTALRNPSTNGWLSKLVDPASKLISAGANRFFSSVFRNRLPQLLPQPPTPAFNSVEDNEEPQDELREASPNNFSEAQKRGSDQRKDLSDNSDGNGISELEQMLKQKSFTRSEIERLTELLHSRTVEVPVRDEDKLTEANCPNPPSSIERYEVFSVTPVQGNRNARDKFPGTISTPAANSRVHEDDVASPAELAKAYMGSRPSKVSSPSVLGLRGQSLREDPVLGLRGQSLREDPATSLNAVSFPSKSPLVSLASKSNVRVGVSENGFMAPRSRGRSAIYSMARTPYSRAQPTMTQKEAGSTNYDFGGPSFSPRGWERGGQSGTKHLALKRSSSTLDADVGSVGPIRRIRQKSNLSIQGTPARSSQMLPKIVKDVEGNGDNSNANTSYAHVPSKSSEVAAKILEHLEKMTPKEKSPGSKLLALRDKSPTKSTPNISPNKESLPGVRDSTHSNQNKFDISGSKNFETAATLRDGVLSAKSADSVISKAAVQQPQKRRAFQMAAHEDTQEANDRIHSNGFALKLTSEGEERKHDKSFVESKVVGAAIEQGKSPAVPEVKKIPAAELPFSKETDSVVGAQNTSFLFSTSSGHSPSTKSMDKVSQLKDSNTSPNMFQSISKSTDKVPPFSFSSGNELPSLKSISRSDQKPESSKSMANVTFGASDAPPNNVEADKADDKNTQKAGDVKGLNTETLPSAASTSPTGMFSFTSGVKNQNPNNGSHASQDSIFAPSSASSSSPLISSFMTSAATATTAFSSPHKTAAPVAAVPFFSFGSSSAPPTAETSVAEVSNKDKVTDGVQSSPFGGPTSGNANTGSSMFGFSSVNTSSTTNNQSHAVVFGTGSGSQVSAPPVASAATGVATISKSTPFQFGSSTSTPVFGASASSSLFGSSGLAASGSTGGSPVFGSSGSTASFATGAPLFGSSSVSASGTNFSSSLFSSSAPTANMFSSGSSFGNTSSTASSGTSSVSSATGASAATFGSSWQPNKSPPTFGATFNSPSSSPSPGFSFGASSSSSAGPTNTMFGSSTGAASSSMFSFTSAAATTSPQPVFGNSVPVFSAPASNGDQMSMEDSMAEDHPVQTSTPAVSIFGQPAPPASTAQPGFMFGSPAASPSVSFQFGSQPSQVGQNPSPFQASNSLDFNPGGSFIVGSGGGGGDKSGRRIVKASRTRNRKK